MEDLTLKASHLWRRFAVGSLWRWMTSKAGLLSGYTLKLRYILVLSKWLWLWLWLNRQLTMNLITLYLKDLPDLQASILARPVMHELWLKSKGQNTSFHFQANLLLILQAGNHGRS